MKTICKLFLLCIATSLTAALSPINQSINELDSILHHRDLADTLGQSEIIVEIRRTDDGYLILTENYEMAVELIYDAKRTIGPRTYRLIFHTPTLREEAS